MCAARVDPRSFTVWVFAIPICVAITKRFMRVRRWRGAAKYHTALGELLVFRGHTDEGRTHYERASRSILITAPPAPCWESVPSQDVGHGFAGSCGSAAHAGDPAGNAAARRCLVRSGTPSNIRRRSKPCWSRCARVMSLLRPGECLSADGRCRSGGGDFPPLHVRMQELEARVSYTIQIAPRRIRTWRACTVIWVSMPRQPSTTPSLFVWNRRHRYCGGRQTLSRRRPLCKKTIKNREVLPSPR